MTTEELNEAKELTKAKNAETRAKAAETRVRNTEAQIELSHEKSLAIKAARTALQKVLEREDVTPEQILEASKLLVGLGR